MTRQRQSTTAGIEIEIRDLCRYFRPRSAREVRAVDGITLRIPADGFAVLTGPSGSGKTTLLSLMGLLDRPTSGSLMLAGKDFVRCGDHELARFRRRVGFAFQDFGLIPRLTALENITYALVPRMGGRAARERRAEEWLDRVGLQEQRASRPEELSGGERQRVAVARALAGNPELLLLDEPTSNLDADSSRVVRELLAGYHRAGKPLVVATHDECLIALATHHFHLRDGKSVDAT